MITDLENAVYEALKAAAAEGQPLYGVTEILDNAMKLVGSGGIAIEGKDESYAGGSGNQRDFIQGEIAVHCVSYITKNDFRTAKIAAEALAKKVRQALKNNLTLVSSAYPQGFTPIPVQIPRTETGYGALGGNQAALASVIVEAQYEENYT